MLKKHKSSAEEARIGMDRCARAEDWFVRLRARDCTEIERAAFRRWLQESPDNETAYSHVQKVWERTAELRRNPAIADATREALDARAPRRRRWVADRRWRWPAAAAAALALAVGLSVMGTSVDLWSLGIGGESFATTTAEQRTITLTDGSTVLLDAESTLRVDYDDESRNLVLEHGQAEFKVTHDGRPFVVKAAGSLVRALGTEFQVRVDDKAVTVTLLQGKVSVDSPGLLGGLLAPPRSEVLTAGQKVEVASRRKPLQAKPADLEVAKGWTHGDLVFKRWRLEDLVAEMNRYSNTRIRIEDDALRNLMVSGRFRAGDQKSLIQALEQEWPIEANHVEDKRITLTMR